MNLLATPRRRTILFTLLYAAEGAPIGFLWWTLPAYMARHHVPLEQSTAITAMLALPWAFKFVWAPIIDILRGRRWGYRGWIFAAQWIMALSLLPLIWIDIPALPTLLFVCLAIHAFAAATQDVAIDALCIANTEPSERGHLNGWMQAGMIVARSLFGGGLLLLIDDIRLAGLVAVLASSIGAMSLLMLLVRERDTSTDEPAAQSDRPLRSDSGSSFSQAVRAHMLGFLSALWRVLELRTTWLGLAFAILGGAAYESVGSVVGQYLQTRLNDGDAVSRFTGILLPLSWVAGSLIGGRFTDRLGVRRATMSFLLATVAAVGLLAVCDHFVEGPHLILRYTLMSLVYVSIGMFVAASYALFMDITDPNLGGTQFSAFMGATNLCESLAGFSIGRLAPTWGFPVAFGAMCVVSLLALPLLRFIRSSATEADPSST